MNKQRPPTLSFQDIEAAIAALEGWLDAFSDDDVFADDVPGVRRAKEALEIIVGLRTEPEPHLRLVEAHPPEPGEEE